MPVAFTESMVPAQPPLPRRRWTREDCEVLEAAGQLVGQRLELIEGELIEKMGKNPPHSYFVFRMVKWLRSIFGVDWVLQEVSIDVSAADNPTNEPEPDAVVLRREVSHFSHSRPGPADVDLLVEVADSTLQFDLLTKARLYARANITEYWVLDINRRRLYVLRTPDRGEYRSVQVYNEAENISPLGKESWGTLLSEILGPS